MKALPLLLQACLDGTYGKQTKCGDGMICEAGFIYLLGKVDIDELNELKKRLNNRMFICMSESWETELLNKYPEIVATKRYQMHLHKLDTEKLIKYISGIPSCYELTAFDEKVFDLKPFMHGSNYSSFRHFKADGAGAVIWCDGKIVASASSFLTHNNAVELDVSTDKSHRNKGLGLACCAAMLLDCAERGLAVHWDAQNTASLKMAEKLGYELEYDYNAYSFIAPEIP